MLAIGIAGLYSYLRLGRAEDLSFTVKVAVVKASWPGVTAQEMRDQIADRIEKKLQELPHLDRIQTYAKPGFWRCRSFSRTRRLRLKRRFFSISCARSFTICVLIFPRAFSGPRWTTEYGDLDSVLYAVYGEGADYHQLDRIAEALRQRLLETPDVVKVHVYGAQDRKVFVEFSQAKLANLGFAPQALFDSLAKQNAVAAAGVFETQANRVPLRVTGALKAGYSGHVDRNCCARRARGWQAPRLLLE